MENLNKRNYIRNTGTSNGRTLRIEVVGNVTEAERHFLNGISLFTAGTLTKDQDAYTKYVSGLMVELVKKAIAKIREGM